MTELVRVDGHFDIDPHKVVLKWTIELGPDPVEVKIPRGARLLHVEFVQADAEPSLMGYFALWYEVEIQEQTNPLSHIFQIVATGIQIPKTLKHLATGCDRDYTYVVPHLGHVWHLYEYPSGAKVVDV